MPGGLWRLIVVAWLAAACTPPRRAEPPLPEVDPSRLDHAKHAQIACISCHRTRRPGADDHTPCDDSGCHKQEFAATPGKVCLVCHTDVVAQPLAAPLKDYPIQDAWQALPPTFSHAKHLDSAVMEQRVGFHVACNDCHLRNDAKVRPDHATCSRCHAAEVELAKVPAMENCSGCHRGQSRQRVRARVLTGDIKFHHDQHRRDVKGAAIKCEDCHKRSAVSTGYDDHAAPRVESCVSCHDDSARVPYELRMRICEGCHFEIAASLTKIAPRSHLPATERPLDHTLAFRRDHAEAAGRAASRCATCHVQMSGNSKDACDECHQRMLPSDHRITFRELDHGPDAVADRNRCATCHVVEFCTACHAQRPRSHGLLGTFNQEHARLSRINPRPCLTCHGQTFCADCHQIGRLRP